MASKKKAAEKAEPAAKKKRAPKKKAAPAPAPEAPAPAEAKVAGGPARYVYRVVSGTCAAVDHRRLLRTYEAAGLEAVDKSCAPEGLPRAMAVDLAHPKSVLMRGVPGEVLLKVMGPIL